MPTLADALQLLEQNKASLGGTQQEQDDLIATIRDLAPLAARQPTDLKDATMIAVDGAKSLIGIGLAVFGLICGFIQFGITHDMSAGSLSIVLLLVALAVSFISMFCGFRVIGTASMHAEGRVRANLLPWGTVPLRRTLMTQSLLGVVVLVLFAVAMLTWKSSNPAAPFSISPVANQQTAAVSAAANAAAPSGQLEIAGQWSALTLRHGTFSLTLAPVQSGQTATIAVDVH